MKKSALLIFSICIMGSVQVIAQAKKPIKKPISSHKVATVVKKPAVVAPIVVPEPAQVEEPKVVVETPKAEEKKENGIGGFFKKMKDKIKTLDKSDSKTLDPTKEKAKEEKLAKKDEIKKDEAPKKISGSSKKAGNFATVWETQFENKAEKIAMVSWDGTIVIGTDDNSASAIDGDGNRFGTEIIRK